MLVWIASKGLYSQAGVVQTRGAHVMLLQLVAAENDQSLGLALAQHNLDKLSPKRSGPAGDQNYLFRPIHSIASRPVKLRARCGPILANPNVHEGSAAGWIARCPLV